MAIIVILESLKDDDFFILQGPHLRPFEAAASIRPPRPFEAATSNPTLSPSEAVLGRSLGSDFRGHLRPKIAKILILPSLKDEHFFKLQRPHLKPFEAPTDLRGLRSSLRLQSCIRPPSLSEAVLGRNLGSDLQECVG